MNSNEIKGIIYNLGAEICGIANIERFKDSPEGFHPQNILADTRSVIVFGCQFPKGVFKTKNMAPYNMVREILNHKIDEITVKITFTIEKEGYTAVPIPSSEPYEYWDSKNRHGKGILSLKHSAVLAGLGSMGKNTLLINEQFGNRLWIGAVITNMELEPDSLTRNLCVDSCRSCLDACPAKALDGKSIVQKECREICSSSTEGGGFMEICNICRKVCPYSNV